MTFTVFPNAVLFCNPFQFYLLHLRESVTLRSPVPSCWYRMLPFSLFNCLATFEKCFIPSPRRILFFLFCCLWFHILLEFFFSFVLLGVVLRGDPFPHFISNYGNSLEPCPGPTFSHQIPLCAWYFIVAPLDSSFTLFTFCSGPHEAILQALHQWSALSCGFWLGLINVRHWKRWEVWITRSGELFPHLLPSWVHWKRLCPNIYVHGFYQVILYI